MKRRPWVGALIGASVLGCAGLAQATTVFVNENFDGYANQAAYEAAWTANATHMTLSQEQAASGLNSVKGSTTATRDYLRFAETGTLTGSTEEVIFRFKFYDSNAGINPYRQYAELDDGTAPTGNLQLVAMGLNNNLLNSAGAGPRYMARVLGYNGGGFFKLDDAGAPARSTGWHTMEARIGDSQIRFYVDTILSKTIDISGISPDRSYETVKVGSNLSSTAVAYFDDVYVARTPEPASICLLAVGGLMLARRRTVA